MTDQGFSASVPGTAMSRVAQAVQEFLASLRAGLVPSLCSPGQSMAGSIRDRTTHPVLQGVGKSHVIPALGIQYLLSSRDTSYPGIADGHQTVVTVALV